MFFLYGKTYKVICVTKNNTSSLLHFTGAILERFYEWQVSEIHVRSHCRESKHWQDNIASGYDFRSMLRITYQYTCNSSQLRARVNEEMQHVSSRSVSSSSIASWRTLPSAAQSSNSSVQHLTSHREHQGREWWHRYMLKVSTVTSSHHGQNRKLSISLIVTKRNPFVFFMIRLQFFRAGALHLLILLIEFTSVDLKILSSPSDHFEIVSDALPTPVHNSFVFTVVISKWKYFNDSERNISWTNGRIFDFLWVRSVVPDHVSSFLTPWSWFVTKLSREIFVVQEASLCSCV